MDNPPDVNGASDAGILQVGQRLLRFKDDHCVMVEGAVTHYFW